MVVYWDLGKIEYWMFKDIFEYFDEGDVMIFNNIKVFFVCLYGKKEKIGVDIEVFFLCEFNSEFCFWDVLVDFVCKIRVGNKFYFSDEYDNDVLVVEVVDNMIFCGRIICFIYDDSDENFQKDLYWFGIMFLFKEIGCKVEILDWDCYQIFFVKEMGVVVVFIVGLYYSDELFK